MKIPLRELELARKDPLAYLRRRESNEGNSFSKSTYSALKRAALKFHELNCDLSASKKYLEESYARLFKNHRSLEMNLIRLQSYADEFLKRGTSVFKMRDRLVITLPNQPITLTAEIPRLDLVSDGYEIWLFSKEPASLRTELRMPLIQDAYSKKMMVPLDEIRVGVYDFATASYENYQYSKRETERALLSLEKLIEQMASIAKPKTLREY